MPKPKRPATQSELSPLELAVMNTIWEVGECGSREAIDAYNARTGRRLADTTIRTVLTNLRKKGYLKPVPTIERGLRLRPAVCREGVARRLFRQLIGQLFDGSPSQAIAHLIRDEKIDEREIEEIRRMVDKAAKERKKP